jgi:hypothetical protein
LVSLTQTLDNLPDTRCISIKLLYYPNTPVDYEPKFFRPSTNSEKKKLSTNFIKLTVGNINTKYHNLNIKIRAISDEILSEDEIEDNILETVKLNEEKIKEINESEEIEIENIKEPVLEKLDDVENETVNQVKNKIEEVLEEKEFTDCNSQDTYCSDVESKNNDQKLEENDILNFLFNQTCVNSGIISKEFSISKTESEKIILNLQKKKFIGVKASKNGFKVLKNKNVKEVLQNIKNLSIEPNKNKKRKYEEFISDSQDVFDFKNEKSSCVKEAIFQKNQKMFRDTSKFFV